METPSSERKTTIAAFGAANSATKSGKTNYLASATKMKGGGRRALLDVTNDSPIVGLALDRDETTESPASSAKRCPLPESVQTPGTGEALLRYQVKSLLQRVETEVFKPPTSLRTLCHLNGFLVSPSRLLAPTPANTPDAANTTTSFATDSDTLLTDRSDRTVELYVNLGISSPGPESKIESSRTPFQENSPFPEVIDAVELARAISTDKPLTRALLFDSPEKNDSEASLSSPSSVISSEDGQKARNMEDDDVSEWSVQVNISSPGAEQADEEGQVDEYVQVGNNEDEEEEEQEEAEIIEDQECEALCHELSKVSVDDRGSHLNGIPEFAGKHTRFVYNSDDEFEGEVVCELPSPSVIRLKGVPTPKGKHLRFSEDDDGTSENASP